MSHLAEPARGANNPGGHSEQDAAPEEPAAEPAAQNAHSVEPAALQLPGPHGEHSAEVATASSSAPALPAVTEGEGTGEREVMSAAKPLPDERSDTRGE